MMKETFHTPYGIVERDLTQEELQERTNMEDERALNELYGKVRDNIDRLDKEKDKTKQILQDHELRIAGLEMRVTALEGG